jgi:hypothetical protein
MSSICTKIVDVLVWNLQLNAGCGGAIRRGEYVPHRMLMEL